MTKEVNGRRRGRPALPADEQRSCLISVRMTPAERADLERLAKADGMADQMGRYLYERGIARKPLTRIPPVNVEAWGRLGKVAGGLTTMAKAAAVMNLPTIDRLLLEEVRDELRAVRLALIGANDIDTEDGGEP